MSTLRNACSAASHHAMFSWVGKIFREEAVGCVLFQLVHDGGVKRALRLIRHYEFVESYHVLEKRSLGLASGDLVIFKNSGMINR